MEIIKLETEISGKQGVFLNTEIENYIVQKKKVICKGLNKKPVFLSKYLEATNNRRDKTRRKQKFWPALELITKLKGKNLVYQKHEQKGISYEFKGITPNGIEVSVHIREELIGKDRKLFLISTF